MPDLRRALTRTLDALRRARSGHPLDYEREVAIIEYAERALARLDDTPSP